MTSYMEREMAAGMTTIAVSGPDNVGKTTQLRILARRAGPVLMALSGPLDDYDPRWRTIKDSGMAAWWFEQGTLAEVADVLACSYLERARRGSDGTALRLVDRGMPMLEATVAATAAVREQLDVQAAAERAGWLLADYAKDIAEAETTEYDVVLLHDDDPGAGAARALSRETSVTPVYTEYQRCLHEQVHRLAAADRFGATIVTGDRSIADIQNELRNLLQEDEFPTVPGLVLPGVRVVALGGLSECGKSTAGEYLRLRHGFARLKIGYLIEQAAGRLGLTDIYSADPVTLAELITDSLDRFATAQHFLDRISIESLHSHDITAELKKILGERLAIVYLDVDAGTRERRGTAGPADVRERDAVKHARGAAAIAGVADHVIGNNGSRLALHRCLDVIALHDRWPRPALRTAPVNSLGLPVHLESYLSGLLDRIEPHVDLVAVTGSGARGKYQHGWSDLDVFVVANALAPIKVALGELSEELGGVKLGLTIVSRAECHAGAVSSRILHVLALLGAGDVVPLWRRPAAMLPAPDAITDVRESVRDGIQAAIEIRRQLIAPRADARALYKLTALLAKIMLRVEGIERPADDDALAELLGTVPADRRDQRAVEIQARTVLDRWLSELPPLDLEAG